MDLKQLEANLEYRWKDLSPTGRQRMIDMIEKEKNKKRGIPLAKNKGVQTAFNKHSPKSIKNRRKKK